jgi:endonuclease III
MPREKILEKQRRTERIIAVLERAYPEAHCELRHANPLELLISTILSAQCTDKQVNIVTTTLFKKHRSAQDYADADTAELEREIQRLGFFRNKAKNIKACCRRLVELHGGNVPSTMGELTQLAGVGRKTANVVLGNAFNISEGIVVDTHVARLSGRLGLTRHTEPEAIERDLINLVPRKQWTMFSHWLIWHGRRRCFARKPNCQLCEIGGLCPSFMKLGQSGPVSVSHNK